MPRGALNTEGPKNQNPRPFAQTARDKDGVPVLLSLLLGPRLRRHKTCEAVVHNDLAVVFTAMFDEAVCYVENARFLATVYDSLHQAFFAFRLDGGCAICEGFLDERNDVGLGLVLVALGIFCCRRLLPRDGIGEEIVCSCRMQQLLCEAALRRRGLEVVFVLGKIL